MPEALLSPDENVWETLPCPLRDILLHEVAPKYLAIPDLLNLSGVSKQYQSLFGPKTLAGNRLLGQLLLQNAKHFDPITKQLLYTDQLPTIGAMSVEESLEDDAFLVWKLSLPAKRRRALILLPPSVDESEERQMQLQDLVSTFRPKTSADFLWMIEKYHCQHRRPASQFLGINLSGVDIYCHWIDHTGQIVPREGDHIPPKPSDQPQTPTSMRMHATREIPEQPFVFRHFSEIQHAFALCFQEGGAPFAIYRQHRGWKSFSFRSQRHHKTHIHAIAILPGGIVQELYCDANRSWSEAGMMRSDVQLLDRSTGVAVPNDHSAPLIGQSNAEEMSEDQLARAKELAREFYGSQVPAITHPSWRNFEEFYEANGGSENSVRRINAVGEAMWNEDQDPTAVWGRRSQPQQFVIANDDRVLRRMVPANPRAQLSQPSRLWRQLGRLFRPRPGQN